MKQRNFLKSITAAVVVSGALLGSTLASAQCFGTGAFRTCSDNSGNTYNITRSGNSTFVQGSNPRTGSNWSSQSITTGNLTNTYGRAANGNTWNQTTIRNPTGIQTFGTDSNGRAFNKSCFGSFCN